MRDKHIVPVISPPSHPAGVQTMLPKGDKLPQHHWPLLVGATSLTYFGLQDRLEYYQCWCSSMWLQKNPVISFSAQTQPYWWSLLWATCSSERCSCLLQGVRTRWALRPLPNPNHLWFYYIISAIFFLCKTLYWTMQYVLLCEKMRIMNRRSFSSADTIPHPFLLLCINSAWHLRSEQWKISQSE